MRPICHALVLNCHQPAGNLEHLLEHDEWAAKELLWALDRMPRALWGCEDVARVHLSLSGTLLETLSDPAFQERVYGIVRCGDLLWHLQNAALFRILGTGYYHPVLPLIPEADREAHLLRWRDLARHLFSRDAFGGFWPPEMGFCQEMIPLLVRMGYRYVLVDSEHVIPVDEMSWPEIRYRPHVAEHDGHRIVVVVRDRQLSDAQESGMEYGWFKHELHERTKDCDFVPLVTTATDGDNGGWFRNTSPKANFWSVFYRPFIDEVRNGWTAARPCFVDEYLDAHGAHGRVKIRTGAWNTGWHNGFDFIQWTGSDRQKEAFRRVGETSAAYHELRDETGDFPQDARMGYRMEEAHWHLLRAQTSCHFYWGEAWVDRCHQDLDVVWFNVDEVRKAGGS